MSQFALPPGDDGHHGPVLAILDKYLADLDEGTAPSIADLLVQHPDQASELERYLDALKMVSNAMGNPTSAAFQHPAEVGPYIPGNIIGMGGMGIVFRAAPRSGGPDIALKILRTQDDDRSSRFQREVKLTQQLNHEHIVPVLDAGTTDGISYYTMPIIDGPSLDLLISRIRDVAVGGLDSSANESQSPEIDSHPLLKVAREHGIASVHYHQAVLDLAATAADVIHFAHERGVIHRDIKPANLIVDRSGKLWIADFGLAGYVDASASSLTHTRDSVGTLGYMSPEQSVGRAPDRRGDIYSLAMTFSELLTLKRPYDTDGNESHSHFRQRIESLLHRAMSVAPSNRHATAAEFADDLRRSRAKRRLSRRSLMVSAALAISGFGGWALWKGQHRSAGPSASDRPGLVPSTPQLKLPEARGFHLSICDANGVEVTQVKPDELFYLVCSYQLGDSKLFAATMHIQTGPGLQVLPDRQTHPSYRFYRYNIDVTGQLSIGVLSKAPDPNSIAPNDQPLWILPCKESSKGTHQYDLEFERDGVVVFGSNHSVPLDSLTIGSVALDVR